MLCLKEQFTQVLCFFCHLLSLQLYGIEVLIWHNVFPQAMLRVAQTVIYINIYGKPACTFHIHDAACIP
jgi:hypothetical protein